MKIKSGLNLYNALISFEIECSVETGTLLAMNKSLDAGKESQVERVEHRPESARAKGVVPTDSEPRILHMQLL